MFTTCCSLKAFGKCLLGRLLIWSDIIFALYVVCLWQMSIFYLRPGCNSNITAVHNVLWFQTRCIRVLISRCVGGCVQERHPLSLYFFLDGFSDTYFDLETKTHFSVVCPYHSATLDRLQSPCIQLVRVKWKIAKFRVTWNYCAVSTSHVLSRLFLPACFFLCAVLSDTCLMCSHFGSVLVGERDRGRYIYIFWSISLSRKELFYNIKADVRGTGQ